jgi:hypothetical protein
MPINVEVKRKDPKFEGDRPSWNIVASGPVELFNEGMEKFMFLHGMNAMKKTGDYAIWTSRPSIAPPQLYLADMLRKKYGFRLKPDTAGMVDRAVTGAAGPAAWTISSADPRRDPADARI